MRKIFDHKIFVLYVDPDSIRHVPDNIHQLNAFLLNLKDFLLCSKPQLQEKGRSRQESIILTPQKLPQYALAT